MNDADNPDWTTADFAAARPAAEVLAPAVASRLVRASGQSEAEASVGRAVRNEGPGLHRSRFAPFSLRAAA